MKEKEQKKITKEERIQMKQKLSKWGGAIEYCNKKQLEILSSISQNDGDH